ncbi:MAG: hypothetical protein HC906_16940, partial [Bacteroidales bacterium]|nr:hypothetical protein [Bacteroidales bacterium]
PQNEKWLSVSIVGEDSKNDPVQPNVLIKEGAIVPLECYSNTEEFSTDSLTLLVSLNEKGIATGMMYEDSGNGLDTKTGIT